MVDLSIENRSRLHQRTNRLLFALVILLVALLLVIGYTLIKIELLNIPTKLIYGG